ncbi:hypothetical protein EJB05_29841 [Eragrostis curvula]|uniref:Uncharacterized protein n=1 Tax=Eragrostis curvula TaxID=38414 RepID=A0A5J9UV40_9POAL|nr:hypothetical protein EJB05_29841 [Eragrostis curvula]
MEKAINPASGSTEKGLAAACGVPDAPVCRDLALEEKGTGTEKGVAPPSPASEADSGASIGHRQARSSPGAVWEKGCSVEQSTTARASPGSHLQKRGWKEQSSNDDGDARDIFAALKISPAEPNPEASKGFTFSEVNCWRTSNSKVVCCHFSSDGKILASAGHEKKAVLWNMENQQTQYLPEEHALIITDVRFRPNSSQLATSSFDRTIKLWNAADSGFSLHTFTGHGFQVTSLDFHPKKTDLLCSCDGSGEIRYWNVTQPTCMRAIKGGTAQVRFQPNTGQYLAAAAENVVSIFDIETHSKKYTLQGHNTDVQSVCWDNSGEYIASVNQDLVKVWSVSSGECIHELSSNGNKFCSCVFHPSYTNLLVIGGYQSLELWNMVKNQSMTVQAHEGLIAALAQSPVTGMVASASHDNSVKLWK